MDKQALLQKVGSMQQVAAVRPVEYREGRARGTTGYEVKNGFLRFQVLADKCMDIGEMSYKGVNLSFLAKPGLTGRMDYDTHGAEGVKSLMGGMLFTCGLENTCLPCTVGETYYPMHGRVRSAPAEHCSADACWQDGAYRLRVSGEMREAELFGKNLVLRRSVCTVYGEKSVTITDEIENLSFLPEPVMLLYHFNFGYPLLDEAAEVVLPSLRTTPRDEAAEKNAEHWARMEAPATAEPERVYLHELAADSAGNTFACLLNPELELGVKIGFSKQFLPHFVQWKSLMAGDYVMGLEPTNSGVYGRAREGEGVHKIAPFHTERIALTLTVLEGERELEQAREQARVLVAAGR